MGDASYRAVLAVRVAAPVRSARVPDRTKVDEAEEALRTANRSLDRAEIAKAQAAYRKAENAFLDARKKLAETAETEIAASLKKAMVAAGADVLGVVVEVVEEIP